VCLFDEAGLVLGHAVAVHVPIRAKSGWIDGEGGFVEYVLFRGIEEKPSAEVVGRAVKVFRKSEESCVHVVLHFCLWFSRFA